MVSSFYHHLLKQDGICYQILNIIFLLHRILEAILISERNRLEQTNFSTLLNHGDFHRSLLACCMEIVISTYEIHEMKFPAILELFKLPAFECCKVVESVIKHQKV